MTLKSLPPVTWYVRWPTVLVAFILSIIVGRSITWIAPGHPAAPFTWWLSGAFAGLAICLLLFEPLRMRKQWALRMHGFNPAEADHDELAPSRIIEPRR